MKKKILISVLLVLVAVSAFAAFLLLSGKFVIAGGGLYPAQATQLNLKKRNLTVSQYEQIQEKMPQCKILWSVPFQDTRLPSDSESVAMSVYSDEDIQNLRYFTELKVLDGSTCGDFLSLAQVQKEHPELQVLYTVQIDGKGYSKDAVSVDVSSMDSQQVAALECLPNLTQVNAAGCTNQDFLIETQKNHPQWKMMFDISIQGKSYGADTETVSVSNCSSEELSLLLTALGNLKTLNLDHPLASGEELAAARNAYPDMQIHWTVDFFGTEYDDSQTELKLEDVDVQSADNLKRSAAYFPDLERLVLIDIDLDDETIAQLRDDVRDSYKVVWRLYIGKCVAMSDDTYFFPTQQRDYYFQDSASYKMKYLEDCIAVDVGDQPNVKNVEWAAYMPHLQYLILAHTNVTNIAPLAHCKELKFLELDLERIYIKDLTPLNECTAMEDLNLGYTVGDASQVCNMTWVKHFWWVGASQSDRVLLMNSMLGTTFTLNAEGKEVDPEGNLIDMTGKPVLRFAMQAGVGAGWRRLPGYYAMRDALNAPYDLTNWA